MVARVAALISSYKRVSWWNALSVAFETDAIYISLNLVVVRCGFEYGPYSILGVCMLFFVASFLCAEESPLVSPVLICAAVYGHKKQPMKTL